jgi:hypothetical protein
MELGQDYVVASAAPPPTARLAEWSEAQVQHWLASLGLAQSAEVVAAFSAEEVDGGDLAGYTSKRVSRILRRAAEPVQDGAALAAAIIAERDALLALGGGGMPPEAMTPRSARWGLLLFDPARQDERHDALQGAVDAWQPKRWVLGGKLGHGSSGVVMACTDKRLGRVAVKFSHGGTSQQLQKLEREAALMQRVAHENVCALREHRALEGGLFGMVLELMDGGSLEQALAQSVGGTLPQAEVVSMALQVLSGLQFMHEQKVIHRDVKPANIMRCTPPAGQHHGTVCYKLIDLSIAAVDSGAPLKSVARRPARHSYPPRADLSLRAAD